MLSWLVLTAGLFVGSQTAPQAPVTVVLETELGSITLEIDTAHAPAWFTGELG